MEARCSRTGKTVCADRRGKGNQGKGEHKPSCGGGKELWQREAEMGLDCQVKGEGPAGIGIWEPWWVLELRSQGMEVSGLGRCWLGKNLVGRIVKKGS